LNYGGAERQLTTLAKALDKEDFDVTVITFYSGGHFEKELEESDIRRICLGKRGRWDVIRFGWRLISQLTRLRPEILHSYLVEPNVIAVLLKPLFPSAKVVWGVRTSNVELKHYDWFTRMNFHIQRFTSRFADLIISNSEAGRDYHLAHGFPADKCIVIHGGVDTELFKPNRKSGRALRAAWGLTDDAVAIGLVGRLDPMKDHPTFLKAAALLSLRKSELWFVCVGNGPEEYEASLRRFAEVQRISQRVIWVGSRADMPSVFNALDIVCSSSSGEGFPNTIAEAMACGLPCVVTDVGDSALLVGDSGIIVPPNDPPALAQGLAGCLEALASGRSPNTRTVIEEKFTPHQLAKKTSDALRSLNQRKAVLSSPKTV
jgi:glycosyltransferase involved in cell wall biosynthesis